ncbi:DEAD/DEAH box helicase, partial [Trichostrongylus colubriformis]
MTKKIESLDAPIMPQGPTSEIMEGDEEGAADSSKKLLDVPNVDPKVTVPLSNKNGKLLLIMGFGDNANFDAVPAFGGRAEFGNFQGPTGGRRDQGGRGRGGGGNFSDRGENFNERKGYRRQNEDRESDDSRGSPPRRGHFGDSSYSGRGRPQGHQGYDGGSRGQKFGDSRSGYGGGRRDDEESRPGQDFNRYGNSTRGNREDGFGGGRYHGEGDRREFSGRDNKRADGGYESRGRLYSDDDPHTRDKRAGFDHDGERDRPPNRRSNEYRRNDRDDSRENWGHDDRRANDGRRNPPNESRGFGNSNKGFHNDADGYRRRDDVGSSRGNFGRDDWEDREAGGNFGGYRRDGPKACLPWYTLDSLRIGADINNALSVIATMILITVAMVVTEEMTEDVALETKRVALIAKIRTTTDVVRIVVSKKRRTDSVEGDRILLTIAKVLEVEVASVALGEEDGLVAAIQIEEGSSTSANVSFFSRSDSGRDEPRGGGSGFGNRNKSRSRYDDDNSRERDQQNKREYVSGGTSGMFEFQVDIISFFLGERAPKDWTPETTSIDTLFARDVANAAHFEKDYDECVKIIGADENIQISSWENSGLHPDLIRTCIDKCHYRYVRPIQAAAIPLILSGRDVMGLAETGGGKTAAFVLPILHQILSMGREKLSSLKSGQILALVVAPTRELARQLYDSFRKHAYETEIKCCVAYGEIPRWQNLSEIHQGCHVLVGTGGRLMDFIQRSDVNVSKIQFLVLDEADMLLEDGRENHLNSILRDPNFPKASILQTFIVLLPVNRQTLLFSATFPADVERLAGKVLKEKYVIVRSSQRGKANIRVKQQFVQAEGVSGKNDKLFEILEAQRDKTTD